jgi:hypothetical protein
MADETDAPLMFDDIPSFDDMPDAPTQPQSSGASSSPLMFDDIPSFDDMKDENRPQAEGQVGTFAREAAHAALPAAGGMLAAGAAGALGGAALGPVGAIAGGIGGMIIGSMATDKAQQWSLEQLGMDDSAQRAANAEENPYTAFAGGLAPAVATMSPVKGLQLAQRGIGAGMMGGFEAGQEYLQEGKVDPLKVAGAATVGAVLPQANRTGEALMNTGARVAGRPNARANPAAEPVQDESASSQQPTVTGDNALAQPAPSNDGDTIGNPQSRSTTGDIGRDQTKGKSAPDAEGNALTQGETDPTIRTAMESWLGEEPGGGKPEPQITASEPGLPIHTGIEEAHQQAVAAAAPHEPIHTGIEEAAAAQAPQAAAPTTVGEFKTSKGSQYQLHEDGSTTRNKSVHPEHPGDEGPKPKSEKTYYLTSEQANALAPPQGKFRIIDHGDGTLSTATPSSGGRWGMSPSQRRIGPVETQPQHGLHPLELWKGTVSKEGIRGYDKLHFGNEVTEINGRAREAVPGGESRPQKEVAPAPVAEHVPAFDAIPETATEGVKPEPKVVTAAVTRMREAGVPEEAIAKFNSLEPSARIAEASKYVNGRKKPGEMARPDRVRGAAPVVEGIKTDEGKPVTARDKADAARKSADVKTMNDAHEALGKIEVPTTPEEKAALKARLQTFLDATKGVTYKPALKHEPYVVARAAKKLLTAKNPSEKSWNTFVSDALVGDEARATQRIEADIGRNKRSGDEAVATAEAKLAEHNDVEDVAIENVNLERATRAIKELDQYFRGARDREELSAKAQKTLSAMPAEIRKAAFDAEPDSPEATKVASWLRNHFTEPQETPVKTARDIKRIEPAAHIDATTPEGQKALDKVLSKAPEEPKASEVRKIKPDAKMLADILERSKQADVKNKAGKAPEGEAPPQVRTKSARDLFDVFSKDEGGKLDLDGIMADVTAALKKTGYAAKKNFWQPKGKDSYIARTPKSPQEEYARSLSDDLQKVRQGDIDHKLGLMQLVDRLPKALNNPEALEKVYLARESGKISSLPPFLQRLYEQHLEPIFEQNDKLFDNIQKLAPDRIGPEVKDHVYRILKGDTSENNILKTGESTDPVEGINAISTAQRGPALNRRFVALERQDGKRFVIALNDNGFTIWKNGSPQRIVDPTFNYKAGDKLTVGKNTFTMKEAMTPEIEVHAKMDGGKSAEYYHNAALSATAANAYLGSMARHLQYLETLKKDPAFTRFASPPGSKAPDSWVTTSLPNFKDWKMDPQLSHVMNDYAQPGFNEANLNFMRRLSQAVTKTIFWLPTAHINNVGSHWFVGRGWDWITPKGYQGLVVDGAKAIKSVISQDAFQSQMREHGAGSIYGGVLTQNFMEKLGKAAGEDIRRNPSKWDPIAKTLGVGPSDLARAIYNGSSKMMWAANDMFLTHQVMENMRKGMDMPEAIQHAERHIPNYRVPTTVLNGGRSGRIMSQVMQDPLVTSFGRYHYGVYNSYAHMVKDLVQGDGHRKLEAIGNLMALGIMAFAVKPLFDAGAKYLTGNDKAEVQSRGPLGPLHHVARSGEALSDPMQFARSTVTIPPLTSTILETLFNKDWRGKSIVEPGTFSKAAHGSIKDMGRVAVQEGEHALRGLVSPVGTAEGVAAKDISPAGGLRDQVLDIRNPSAAQKKYEANIARTSEKAVKSRFKKPPGQLEKAYNKTFGY